jgi:hypothetical protein
MMWIHALPSGGGGEKGRDTGDNPSAEYHHDRIKLLPIHTSLLPLSATIVPTSYILQIILIISPTHDDNAKSITDILWALFPPLWGGDDAAIGFFGTFLEKFSS